MSVVELTAADQEVEPVAWFWFQGLLAAKGLGRLAGTKARIYPLFPVFFDGV